MALPGPAQPPQVASTAVTIMLNQLLKVTGLAVLALARTHRLMVLPTVQA